jgi:hypothetical protein
MIRARFYCNAQDYRPVEWPVKHPYWCTGYSFDTNTDLQKAVIVAYADNIEEIQRLWPDAERIDADEAESYVFTDRFKKPHWLTEQEPP